MRQGSGIDMLKQLLTLGLLCSLLGLGSGCRLACGRGWCPDFVCDTQHCEGSCDDACGLGCGPVRGYRGCADCGADCGPCDDSCDTACGPPCCHRGPIRAVLGGVFRLLTYDSWCGRSCGPRYWGDFFSDPTDCCDPCDRCGNYTGTHVRGCTNCGGGYSQAVDGTYDEGAPAAVSSRRTPRTVAQRSQVAPRTQVAPRDQVARPKAYASGDDRIVGKPRIISETDRVVEPAQLPQPHKAVRPE